MVVFSLTQRKADALDALASVQIASDPDQDRATFVVLIEDERGKPLGVGRTMRTAPRWMRVALKARDHTCSFPGCDRTDFLVPHHIHEWAQGGSTDPDNLPLGCTVHNALAHKPDWHIEPDPSGGWTWIGPSGPVRDGPPPLDYDAKKWLWEDLYRPSVEHVLPDRPRKNRKRAPRGRDRQLK